ncbi:MAG: hypothetical protein Q8K07_19910 [Methylicorpusculum sp.]|uniref:hypothetical protein n=2 Tax=Pseudomonadota TaxID=1224 RepID=UPI002730204F|nr:hypothetical protein [Methylicorpusculum sp.]MDP2204288.1 hypothetical protein [Methylicorpusculum sp.]
MNYEAITIFPVNCHSWYRLALAFLLISLCGCTTFRPDRWYLHNPAHNDLADQAKSNWTPVQDNLWQSMLKNQKLTADAEIQTQRLLQQSVVKSHHLQLINMTWSEMRTKIEEYKNSLEKENEKLEKDKQSALEESTEIGKEIKELMDKTKSRQKAVDEAKANVETWQKELDLFEKATHDFLLRQANESEQDGKSVDTQDLLKELQKQATAIAGNKDLKKIIPKNGIIDRPPGVTLEILSLGSDLAKAQLDRAKMIGKRLQEENNLIDARQKEIATTLIWVKKSMPELNDVSLKSELNTTVFASIQKSLNIQTKPNTEALIKKLQKYVLADDLYTLNDNIYDISKAVLIHHYEIENSAISSKEREVLIQRGLETLVAYHNGGITQEEINTIIQAAQAVALAVISAGVI